MDDVTHLNASPRPNCIDNLSLKNRWTSHLGLSGNLSVGTPDLLFLQLFFFQ